MWDTRYFWINLKIVILYCWSCLTKRVPNVFQLPLLRRYLHIFSVNTYILHTLGTNNTYISIDFQKLIHPYWACLLGKMDLGPWHIKTKKNILFRICTFWHYKMKKNIYKWGILFWRLYYIPFEQKYNFYICKHIPRLVPCKSILDFKYLHGWVMGRWKKMRTS